ncbi:hypothetical protein R6Q57_003713 [Mikania cordata]
MDTTIPAMDTAIPAMDTTIPTVRPFFDMDSIFLMAVVRKTLLCSYLLSGYTKKDVRSNEATMKYLLMGGASSSILVHGFSWLYGSSGGEIELQEIVNGLINTKIYNSSRISIALIFITVEIGFKLSPAPSRQWTPDVYEGVRNRMDLVLYIREEAASASATRIFDIPFYFSSNEWHLLLEILAILSMILGNLIAITQTSMKRILRIIQIEAIGCPIRAYMT